MTTRTPFQVLFLCTGNSARSILGEYLMRELGGRRFDTASAGARPTGRVHPAALEVLRNDYGIEAEDATSKSIQDLEGRTFDLVFTVCDNAAESCPVWPQDTVVVHWGLPDPAAVTGSEEEVLGAFRDTARELRRRLKELCSLPLEELPADRLESRARRIAEAATAGATG